METVACTSTDKLSANKQNESIVPIIQGTKKDTSGIFTCSYCTLQERFDFKGTKAPFARQMIYLEQCYIMKDPFSLPNKGEVLVIGADCSICKKSVCLGCSIFYGKRFCLKCAHSNEQNLPSQLHPKIKILLKNADI